MFPWPDLKPAFSRSGGKPPRPEKPPGLMDAFKAAVVSLRGPALCERLNATLMSLTEKNSENGRAKDVPTYTKLQHVTNRVQDFRMAILQGGAQSYDKFKDAGVYLARLHKHGLDA